MQLRTRRVILFSILGLLGILTAISLEKISEQERGWRTELLESSPQFLHSERMQVAAAEAVMDALNVQSAPSNAQFQAEYLHHRMQLQADWLGMEQLAAHDPERRGLLMEIRTSIANLFLALDTTTADVETPNQTTGKSVAAGTSAVAASDTMRLHPAQLRDALQRAQTALSNYSGSLEQESARRIGHAHTTGFRVAWISLALLCLFCVALVAMLA